MFETESCFKLVTKDNWELLSIFLDFNPAAMKNHIGYFIWWTGVPGEGTWSFSPTVPEMYITVTDGYIGNRIVPRDDKPTRRRKK